MINDTSRLNINIKSDSYLYGVTLSNLAREPYLNVLLIKYLLAQKLFKDLILNDSEDTNRVNAVNRAMDFNRDMIKELGYSDPEIRVMLEECCINHFLGSEEHTVNVSILDRIIYFIKSKI